MCCEIAASIKPLASRIGIAAAEIFTFKGTNTIATFTLVHNGLHQNALEFHALFGLDGTHEGSFIAHDKPPARLSAIFIKKRILLPITSKMSSHSLWSSEKFAFLPAFAQTPEKPSLTGASMPTAPLDYRYVHVSTEATTGYFACEPPADMSFDDELKRLNRTPCDTFLHKTLLDRLRSWPKDRKDKLLRSGTPVEAALAAESLLLHETECSESDAEHTVSSGMLERLRDCTPLPFLDLILRKRISGEMDLCDAWNRLFRANLEGHHPLPHPEDIELPLPGTVATRLRQPICAGPKLAELTEGLPAPKTKWERPPAQQTAAEALMNLASSGILAGPEMRHEASLSPVGLLRNWVVDLRVELPGFAHTLRGEATTWGRGTSLAAARASYAMEMVERASAYLSCTAEGISDRKVPLPLVHATFADLISSGKTALSPDSLAPAVPYRGQALWWTEGVNARGDAVWIPAQLVGLFCNLDEPDLFLSPGSTGLAAGNTPEEACLSALLELFERDAEAVMPWRREQCFTLSIPDAGQHAVLAALLTDYKKRGIHVWFRDMTTEFGVPCFQCLVSRPDGTVAKGSGAGMAAVDALLSALTEVPYPYPGGPASAPAPAGLPRRDLHDTKRFPDYHRQSAKEELALLECLLDGHGHTPLYVDLTREDLDFPVVRAIVPGLETVADFDRFSTPSLRLFRNVLQERRHS